MEKRLEAALEFANYRQTLNVQLQKAKVKAEGSLLIAKAGGTFTINQELICFLDYLIRTENSSATLLDNNNMPIHIEDLHSFLKDISSRYFEVTNDYFQEYQTIRKARNVKSIVDLKVNE
jgi:hypothetical protein